MHGDDLTKIGLRELQRCYAAKRMLCCEKLAAYRDSGGRWPNECKAQQRVRYVDDMFSRIMLQVGVCITSTQSLKMAERRIWPSVATRRFPAESNVRRTASSPTAAIQACRIGHLAPSRLRCGAVNRRSDVVLPRGRSIPATALVPIIIFRARTDMLNANG